MVGEKAVWTTVHSHNSDMDKGKTGGFTTTNLLAGVNFFSITFL